MRTTLKRGIGRGEGANGNGRSLLPPDALSPMRVYRQPDPPRRSGWRVAGRVALWVLAALVMVGLGLAGGIYLWLHESVAAIQPHNPDTKAAVKYTDKLQYPKQAAIGLVLGYDHRAGEAGTGGNSDTLMLVRADPVTKTISLLSFPRDLRVEIHCPGRAPFLDKINAAYSLCGSKGSVLTVKALTGLPVNYLITVNFRGFKKVVNTMGGVWVDVDRRYYNNQGGPGGYAKINLQPGYQLLTGGSALDYVRYRHGDSDLVRVARQQQFVQALKEQFAQNFSISKVPQLVGAVTHNVEVGEGGGASVGLGTILRYANLVWSLPAGHFFQARISDVTQAAGSSDLLTPQSDIDKAVDEFTHPDVEATKQANNVALGIRSRKPKPLKPARTTVQVLNANGVPGAAALTRGLLQQKGYRILEPPAGAQGNSPQRFFHTIVFYDARDGRAKLAARSVAKLFVPADVKPLPRGLFRRLANGALVTVAVGTSYHNTLTPVQTPPTIKRTPPVVRYDPGETEALVRSKQKLVPFRLEVPTVIERNSSVNDQVPIRAYRIDGGTKAVYVTFQTGGNKYWGIEETNWDDAPVFHDKNFRHVIKGRTYDLYYHGSHLHMVVLHENGATYWVINTLLDDLSNETMLAIAKGLKPLAAPAPHSTQRAAARKARARRQ